MDLKLRQSRVCAVQKIPFVPMCFVGHHVTGTIWMMNNMLIENRRKSSDFSLCARVIEVRRSQETLLETSLSNLF